MSRATVGLGIVCLLFLPCSLLALGGAAVSTVAGCSEAIPPPTDATSVDVDAEQIGNASRIVAAVRSYGPTRDEPYAAVVALATAMQESTLRNLRYGDRDSLGLFQQRPSQGWGTPEQVLDVEHATRSFLAGLVGIPHWQDLPLTEAAAAVQRPAAEYAGLYARWQPLGERLVRTLWTGAVSQETQPDCEPGAVQAIGSAGSGAVVYPVPPALTSSDRHNWGGQGGMWNSWHTGTDFSVPCGTPVFAATSGRVELVAGPSWFGAVLVKVSTGPEDVTTWYAHMQAVHVEPGAQVEAGQQLGEAGELGNATGCHLHFEVHLRNGDIYGADNTDPSAWLASHARAGRAT